MKRLTAIIAALLTLCSCAAQPVEAPTESETGEKNTVLSCQYYDEDVYEKAVEAAAAYETEGGVISGVIPHHGTASKMIASFYSTLTDDYDTVILIGPNHYGQNGGVVYSACDWRTEKGKLENDGDFTALLESNQTLKAVRADETVQNDHSIGWHLPFIADYLGDTKIAAIMLSGLASQMKLNELVDIITEYAKDKSVLVLGSVDFSHYLMPKQAMEKNDETKAIIAAKDYGALMSLTSDNVDSPETVYVVMRATEALGRDGLTLLDESVSYEQAGGKAADVDIAEGTTTYLVYAGVKQ